MTEHTGPGDSPAGGWGRATGWESDTGNKDERLQPRFQAWTTAWTVESLTDKGEEEENQIWRTVTQHLLEGHHVPGVSRFRISLFARERLSFGPKSNKEMRCWYRAGYHVYTYSKARVLSTTQFLPVYTDFMWQPEGRSSCCGSLCPGSRGPAHQQYGLSGHSPARASSAK